MKHKNVCILGGTGFIGSHMAPALVEAGCRVRVLTRRRERHRALIVVPGIEVMEADVYDRSALEKALEGQDAVINLVGILNERGHDGKGFERAHAELPARIAEACKASGVTRLLHMSALNAGRPGARSHYLRTKGLGEDRVHAAADERLAVTSFRPSVVFGRGDGFFSLFAGLLRVSPVLPLAGYTARFAPVWVGDVVQAFVRALDAPASHGQRYDLCGPREYSLKQLVEYTARVIGVRRIVWGLGPTLSRWQANLFEYVPGKPLSRDNYLSLLSDSTCARGVELPFGIEPTPLEAVVPTYLGKLAPRRRFYDYRAAARR
jgi:uncharacterized protein YbjT (DUF2867 family)